MNNAKYIVTKVAAVLTLLPTSSAVYVTYHNLKHTGRRRMRKFKIRPMNRTGNREEEFARLLKI